MTISTTNPPVQQSHISHFPTSDTPLQRRCLDVVNLSAPPHAFADRNAPPVQSCRLSTFDALLHRRSSHVYALSACLLPYLTCS